MRPRPRPNPTRLPASRRASMPPCRDRVRFGRPTPGRRVRNRTRKINRATRARARRTGGAVARGAASPSTREVKQPIIKTTQTIKRSNQPGVRARSQERVQTAVTRKYHRTVNPGMGKKFGSTGPKGFLSLKKSFSLSTCRLDWNEMKRRRWLWGYATKRHAQ